MYFSGDGWGGNVSARKRTPASLSAGRKPPSTEKKRKRKPRETALSGSPGKVPENDPGTNLLVLFPIVVTMNNITCCFCLFIELKSYWGNLQRTQLSTEDSDGDWISPEKRRMSLWCHICIVIVCGVIEVFCNQHKKNLSYFG